MSERQNLIDNFLKINNWHHSEIKLLAADASFRRYYRVCKGNETLVLMDAPPPKEDIRPFIKINRHLCKLGLSAPSIIAEDKENGLLLLDDFGDDTYTRLLEKKYNEKELYALAIDVLIKLNSLPEDESVPEDLPLYDNEKLLFEVSLFTDWYMPSIFKRNVTVEAREEYINLWKDAFKHIHKMPQSLVLRDYHVDNLMRIKDRKGLEACGLLDFQDAVKGPLIYDIVSLMEDARRDINQQLIAEMKARYLSAFDGKNGKILLDLDEFDAAWAVIAACRHAKVIGIFTRLCVRDGKPSYLVHIPRLWRLLENSLTHPALFKLKEWFNINIPHEIRKTPNVRAA